MHSERRSYLWRNYFNKFIEKTELANFIVKPFATAFHTRLQNLYEKYNVKIQQHRALKGMPLQNI